MKNRQALFILIPLLIIVGFVLNGCSGTEYFKVTAIKRGISFFFEYPSTYEKLTPDTFDDVGGDHSVSLLYSKPGSTQSKADIQIYVIPFAPIAGRADATAWTEEHLKILEENDKLFKLIERSTIQISGIDAKMTGYFSTILGNYLNSTNLICRDVYVDYKGYIWKISVLAVEEISDQAKSVFEHLIESFKFLD